MEMRLTKGPQYVYRYPILSSGINCDVAITRKYKFRKNLNCSNKTWNGHGSRLPTDRLQWVLCHLPYICYRTWQKNVPWKYHWDKCDEIIFLISDDICREFFNGGITNLYGSRGELFSATTTAQPRAEAEK